MKTFLLAFLLPGAIGSAAGLSDQQLSKREYSGETKCVRNESPSHICAGRRTKYQSIGLTYIRSEQIKPTA
jgi:hypothetical protein